MKTMDAQRQQWSFTRLSQRTNPWRQKELMFGLLIALTIQIALAGCSITAQPKVEHIRLKGKLSEIMCRTDGCGLVIIITRE